jgi:hypothetical protein
MPNFWRFCLSSTKELATGARGAGFPLFTQLPRAKIPQGACNVVLSHLSQNRAEDVGKEQQVQVSGVLEVLGDEVKIRPSIATSPGRLWCSLEPRRASEVGPRPGPATQVSSKHGHVGTARLKKAFCNLRSEAPTATAELRRQQFS